MCDDLQGTLGVGMQPQKITYFFRTLGYRWQFLVFLFLNFFDFLLRFVWGRGNVQIGQRFGISLHWGHVHRSGTFQGTPWILEWCFSRIPQVSVVISDGLFSLYIFFISPFSFSPHSFSPITNTISFPDRPDISRGTERTAGEVPTAHVRGSSGQPHSRQ